MPTIIPGNYEETTHRLKSGVRRHFRPVGKRHRIDKGVMEPLGGESREDIRSNPIERIGGGGFTARIFLGLNVGDKPTYTVDQVVADTIKIRKKQGTLPDASFLAQRGVYTQSIDGKVIRENSVQIIIIDVEGKTKEAFTKEVNDLGVALREHFKQESVIVEIQERGIVQDIYSITA